MRIRFGRFMLGVLVGEGAICAIYIFAGVSLLDLGKRLVGADIAEAQAAAQPSGEVVYAEHCALCHEQVDERIPHRSALRQMPAARIVCALDAGAMLWEFDTARDFDTVNGVAAHGGSLDGQGVVVADGLVLVSSGYPRNGGMPGNVLLSFRAQP